MIMLILDKSDTLANLLLTIHSDRFSLEQNRITV